MSEKTTVRRKTLRTFAKTWDFETVIYSIGDITLPFAVNLTQLGFFAVSFVLLLIIYAIIPPLNNISWIARFLVFPYLLMKAGTKLKVDGKKPYMWIAGEVQYLFLQPKRLNKFRPCKKVDTFSFEKKNIRLGVK